MFLHLYTDSAFQAGDTGELPHEAELFLQTKFAAIILCTLVNL